MTTDTKTLPLLSLRNLVLFPGAVMPVEIGRASSLRSIEAWAKGAHLLVGTQKDADIEEPGRRGPVQDLRRGRGRPQVVKAAREPGDRGAARDRTPTHHRLHAGEALPGRDLRAAGRACARTRSRSTGWAWRSTTSPSSSSPSRPTSPTRPPRSSTRTRTPARLGDITAATVDLSSEERASLLVEIDVAERLRRLLVLLQRKVELIKVKQKIDTQVREEFSKHQREAVLRQKLKAIQDELGEGEDGERPRRLRGEDQDRRDARGGGEGRRASSWSGCGRWPSRRPSTPSSAPTSSGWCELPWTKQTEDTPRSRSGAQDPRRRSLRPRRR